MSERLNRRRFLKGLAAGVSTLTVASLAACGGGTTTPAEQPAGEATVGAGAGEAPVPAAQAPAGVQQVRGLVWSNGPVIDENFNKRVTQFNESHSDTIKMDLQFLPYDQYWQKIDLAYASNQPYDIYFWDVQAYGHYKRDLLLNQQQLIESKSDLLDETKYPTKLFEPWKFDGQNLYGMPENIQTMAFFYNADLLDKAGIKHPDDTTTWDQAMAVAQETTLKEGDRTTQFGMDIGALSVWWGLQTLSWAQDKSFFDKVVEPTKFQMTDPVNTAALQFAQDLVWKTNVSPTPTQGESMGSDVGLFQSGRCAMKPEGSWAMSGFAELPFKWAMAPLPTWNGKRVVPYWLGGWNIPKASKVTEAAFEFARWSGSEFQPQMAKDHDWIPILNSSRQSEDMKAGMPTGFDQAMATLDSAQVGDLYHLNSAQILGEVFGPIYGEVLNNTKTPADAAKEIDEKATALLQKA